MTEVQGLVTEPYEILELGDQQTIKLKVRSWAEGQMTIHPRYAGAPDVKRIPVLRLYVVEGYKERGPDFWDVTSKTLQAQLRPLLPELVRNQSELEIQAWGFGPQKRFTVRV